MIGRITSTCGLFVRSIQMRMTTKVLAHPPGTGTAGPTQPSGLCARRPYNCRGGLKVTNRNEE